MARFLIAVDVRLSNRVVGTDIRNRLTLVVRAPDEVLARKAANEALTGDIAYCEKLED